MSRHLRLRYALPLPLALAVFACTVNPGQQPAAPGTTSTVSTSGVSPALAQAAAAAGLVPASSTVGSSQFQVRDGNGKAVAGVVLVNGQALTTDANGAVSLTGDQVNTITNGGSLTAQVSVPGYVPQTVQLVPGFALQLTPLDPTANTISAASGGLARNADDSLEVSFAPNSLDQDATVSVTKIFNAGTPSSMVPAAQLQLTPDAMGTYSYHLDLGGAQLTPGANVIVKFKVQGDLLNNFQTLQKAGNLDKSNIKDDFSTDGQGNMWFSMQVPAAPAAPAAGAGQYDVQMFRAMRHDAFAGGDVGRLGLLPGLLRPIRYASYTPPPPPPPPCQTFHDAYQYWSQDVLINSVNGGVDQNNACINNPPGHPDASVRFHDWSQNNGSCVYLSNNAIDHYSCVGGNSRGLGAQLVDWKLLTAYHDSTTVTAHVSWRSNDSRISGPVGGALVNFQHASWPERSAAPAVWTNGNGDAVDVGASGAGGYGYPVMPGKPYLIPGGSGYTVNCQTANMTLTKNDPAVTLAASLQGSATGGTYALPTSNGTWSTSTLNGASESVALPDVNQDTASFQIQGSWQPDASTWIDASSSAVTLEWNNGNNGFQATSLPTTIWFSRQGSVALRYQSNDDQVPADQQPASKWDSQAATASVTFNHQVSSYPNKKHSDQLSFQGAQGSASAWGLNGTTGQATATVTGSGETLSGTQNYQIGGPQATLLIPANLPQVTIPLQAGGPAGAYTLTYTIDGGAEKTMQVTPNSAGALVFSLPVEDALNNPAAHTFQLKLANNGDYTVFMPNNSENFPAMGGLSRGKSFTFPAQLKGVQTTAK